MKTLTKTNNLNNLFDLFFERPALAQPQRSLVPSMNAHETEKEFHLEFELPGFSKDDIELRVDNDDLVITANHKEVKEDKDNDKKWLKREISTGHYQRRMTLPENVDIDNISAESKNGILSIVIPKVEVPDKVKKIDIKG